jgi:Carboxypeptidase regulatory-like domain/Photosynthesis system II assembly factor YCF48
LDKLAEATAPTARPALKDEMSYGILQRPVVAGKVTDPSGAVVPNALVKITNAETKQSAAVRTDASGQYKFAPVTPGAYSVEATAPGMEAAKNEVQVTRDLAQNLTLKPAAAAETVDVAAAQPGAAGGVLGGSRSENMAKAAPAAPPPAQEAQADAVQALRQQIAPQQATGGPTALARSRRAVPSLRWRAGSKGAIERSSDGTTWEAVTIDPAVTFRSISSNDGDLWAGGSGGALFHSADAGRTWSRVKVGSEGMWVSDTITAVDFPSARTGYVTTASGATWLTQDAGRTWQRRQ